MHFPLCLHTSIIQQGIHFDNSIVGLLNEDKKSRCPASNGAWQRLFSTHRLGSLRPAARFVLCRLLLQVFPELVPVNWI